MVVRKSKLSFNLLKPVAVHIFFSSEHTVLSGEGSMNGKSSLCELIIMQKSTALEALHLGFLFSVVLNSYA